MNASRFPSPTFAARRRGLALFVLGLALGGCADMSDSMMSAFADPAKYDLYECKQLEADRKVLAARAAELQGLMAKAQTGVAGPVVAELAYRNEYIAVRGASQICRRGLAAQQMPFVAAGRRCAGAQTRAANNRQRPAPGGILRQRGLRL